MSDESIDSTDTTIIEKNLSIITDEQKVVLVGTGSFNPVHIGHIEVLAQIKKNLEEKHGFFVTGAFISPSHQRYVRAKLREDAISDFHRCNMIHLAIEEAGYGDWLKLDTWELEQSVWNDYPITVDRMRKFLKNKFPEEKLRVIYCCGADHLTNCGCWDLRNEKFGVASVSRPGYIQTIGDHVFLVESHLDFNISSSLIRSRLGSDQDLSKIEYKSVVEYLKKNKILC
jgi:nicotinamide mononucleotide adenylyltransferase